MEMKKVGFWTPQMENKLFEMVEDFASRHYPVEEALEKFSKITKKSFDSIRTHWYGEMVPQREIIKKIQKVRKVVKDNQGEWTRDEDKMIIKCVKYTMSKDRNISDAFQLASKKLGRTRKACFGRWYNVLKKKNGVKMHMEKFTKELSEAL